MKNETQAKEEGQIVTAEEYELVQLMKDKKLTEEDFDFLLTLKDSNFTIKDIKELKRLQEIKKEDKQRNRLYTINNNKRKITFLERDIKHKQGQISCGVCSEKHENYLEDKKPLFMLDNDIDEINAQIEQLKEVNELTQKEYDDNRD